MFVDEKTTKNSAVAISTKSKVIAADELECDEETFFELQMRLRHDPGQPNITSHLPVQKKNKENDEAEFMLNKRPLRKPYTYVKNS